MYFKEKIEFVFITKANIKTYKFSNKENSNAVQIASFRAKCKFHQQVLCQYLGGDRTITKGINREEENEKSMRNNRDNMCSSVKMDKGSH